MGLFRSSTNDNFYAEPDEDREEEGLSTQVEASPQPAVGRDSVLAQGQFFEGKLTGEGSVRVDGTFQGEIRIQGSVSVSVPGAVNGVIEATNVLVSGAMEGNIIARGTLRLTSTCVMKGDVQAEALVIEDGASFDGRSKMLSSEADVTPVPSPAIPALGDLAGSDLGGSDLL